MMKTAVIGLLAESSLHPGAGSTGGVVDLPVAREAATCYPFIPGSSLKGAMRGRAEQQWFGREAEVKGVFGNPDGAGGIAMTDARLLLLPVRSLTGHYRWLTCPYLLQRFQRDLVLAGMEAELPDLSPEKGQAIARAGEMLFLEEFSFEVMAQAALDQVAREIQWLVYHQSVQARLAEQIVVLHDDDFAHFARYGLPVNARNVLNNDTKTSVNLWYEETIPPDTLLYSLLLTQPGQEAALGKIQELIRQRPYLQVGGNESVGQGWCAVSWREGGVAQ